MLIMLGQKMSYQPDHVGNKKSYHPHKLGEKKDRFHRNAVAFLAHKVESVQENENLTDKQPVGVHKTAVPTKKSYLEKR